MEYIKESYYIKLENIDKFIESYTKHYNGKKPLLGFRIITDIDNYFRVIPLKKGE